jgi:hypothetical protein
MNKSAELAVLDEAILKVGRDSYLGPWLAEIRAEVEALIRSDIFPTISLNETSLRREELIKEAREEAGKIVASANRKAEQIESVARACRKEAAEKLRHLAATLA